MDLESEKVGARPAGQPRATTHPTRGPDAGPLVFQELFSKQQGYLDEELDYREQPGRVGFGQKWGRCPTASMRLRGHVDPGLPG